MFALAIWDDERGVGMLARDHVGKKPLYVLARPGCLYFASEIKALLVVPGFDRRADPIAIHHYLSYKHVPAPRTAFAGISAIRPAETLTWSPSGALRTERYWSLSWRPDPQWERMDEREVAARLTAALREGVRRRLLSDVPIGFYLSGGVDSSLSTALAATVCPGAIKTFTLTYDDASTTAGKDADSAWARRVAAQYGTEHYEERLSLRSFAAEFRRVLACFDEPFSGVVSPYFLSRLIGRHVKVALSGDGADELFGSYLSHRLAPAIAAYLSRGPRALDEPAYAVNRAIVEQIAQPDPGLWRARLHVFNDVEKTALYAPGFREQVREASSEAHCAEYFAEFTAIDPLNRILEGEFKGIFPDQVLTFVDRLSMAHSLETRTAFLDRDFVELAASLPGRLKINGTTCKYILKQAAKDYLPPGLVDRPKEGFVMPVNQWLMSDLGDFTGEALAPPRIRAAGILDDVAVGELLARFRHGDATLANRVLSLIALQVWWEDYLSDARTS
jgi:asparagine synthase (glutamine-hydrolysing)